MPPPGVCSVREAELAVNGKRKGIDESPGFGFVDDEACVGGSGYEYGGNDEVDGRGGTWEVDADPPVNELGALGVEESDEDDVPRRKDSRPVPVPGTFERPWASSGGAAMDPETARQPSTLRPSWLRATPNTAPSGSSSDHNSGGLEPFAGT